MNDSYPPLVAQAPRQYPAFPRRLAIFGSTGSIGQSTLQIVRQNPELFEVVALSAASSGVLLAEQTKEFRPRYVWLAQEPAARAVRDMLGPDSTTQVLSSIDSSLAHLARSDEVDVVVAAIVGVAGLESTLAALRAGKLVALANKESLVAAGALVEQAILQGGGAIIPVDSEHSAIFQALMGQRLSELSSVTITASGGPFWKNSLAELTQITPEQAVRHPRWNMGAKISVDSATMANKALEIIEASWLFGLTADQIEVLIHPQSIVHSMVHFCDGSCLAQLSWPDMRGPISLALRYPEHRLLGLLPRLRLADLGALHFEAADAERFQALTLGYACLDRASNAAAVFNMANELAVAQFLQRQRAFLDIVSVAQRALDKFAGPALGSLEAIVELGQEVSAWISEDLR